MHKFRLEEAIKSLEQAMKMEMVDNVRRRIVRTLALLRDELNSSRSC